MIKVQYTICYTTSNDETLHVANNVDPTNPVDREMLHGLLDEFIDSYLLPLKRGRVKHDSMSTFEVISTSPEDQD